MLYMMSMTVYEQVRKLHHICACLQHQTYNNKYKDKKNILTAVCIAGEEENQDEASRPPVTKNPSPYMMRIDKVNIGTTPQRNSTTTRYRPRRRSNTFFFSFSPSPLHLSTLSWRQCLVGFPTGRAGTATCATTRTAAASTRAAHRTLEGTRDGPDA